MESKVNYTVVGLFVVLLGAALIFGMLWLSSSGNKKDYANYVVYLNESASGLNEKATVKFNGVDVGYVESIQLNPNNLQQVRLLLKIETHVPITQTTVAILKSQGITGLNYIGLKAESATAPELKAKPGEKYPVIPSEPSFLVELDTAVREVADNINKLSDSFRQVFDENNQEAIKQSLASIAELSKTLSDNSEKIDASLQYLTRVLHNTSQASEEFPVVIDKMKTTLVTVEKASDEFAKASEEAALALRQTRTAVQGIAQQAMPGAIIAMQHLKSVAINLQQITQELKRDPSIILRGKEQTDPVGPGER